MSLTPDWVRLLEQTGHLVLSHALGVAMVVCPEEHFHWTALLVPIEIVVRSGLSALCESCVFSSSGCVAAIEFSLAIIVRLEQMVQPLLRRSFGDLRNEWPLSHFQ